MWARPEDRFWRVQAENETVMLQTDKVMATGFYSPPDRGGGLTDPLAETGMNPAVSIFPKSHHNHPPIPLFFC